MADAEIERLQAIVDKLNILDIAACEAFCDGVTSGQATQGQIDAMLYATGGIRGQLKDAEMGAPFGKGMATAHFLRQLADKCEAEAAAKENSEA